MSDVPLLSMRVLVVEDDGDMRLILKLLLEHQFGFEVFEAPNAELGIELAGAEKPDLILMDLVMPGMGGFEAISLLKANQATAAIPIIVISDRCWERQVREDS